MVEIEIPQRANIDGLIAADLSRLSSCLRNHLARLSPSLEPGVPSDECAYTIGPWNTSELAPVQNWLSLAR